jgi:hypothetical protein
MHPSHKNIVVEMQLTIVEFSLQIDHYVPTSKLQGLSQRVF